MVHHSFLSSPSIHSEKGIFGHAVWFAHQVAHTTHRMLLQVSLHTRHWHQPALLKSATWGQGGGRGNKFIISFPSSPYPISFPAVTWPIWIKISQQISASITTASSFLRHLTWLLRPGNRFYLRWVKLDSQPIGQRKTSEALTNTRKASPRLMPEW